MDWSIGQKVGVFNGSVFIIGLISFVGEDQKVDVIYNDDSEESNISNDRIRALFDFEMNHFCDNRSANTIKEDGNKLFTKKDYIAAERQYKKALESILKPISIGSSCIIIPQEPSGVFRTGIISDVSGGKLFEVLFDEIYVDSAGLKNGSFTSEEPEVCEERLVSIADKSDDCNLQRILYGNLAKCCVQLKKKGWAVRYATLSIELLKVLIRNKKNSIINNNLDETESPLRYTYFLQILF